MGIGTEYIHQFSIGQYWRDATRVGAELWTHPAVSWLRQSNAAPLQRSLPTLARQWFDVSVNISVDQDGRRRYAR